MNVCVAKKRYKIHYHPLFSAKQDRKFNTYHFNLEIRDTQTHTALMQRECASVLAKSTQT